MGKYNLNVRISQEERRILDEYCVAAQTTQCDVVREFIRSLEGRAKKCRDGS
jgi:hypothetical protein